VTVTDSEKPSIIAPAAVNVSTDPGKCTASGVSLGTPVTSDNCTVASVTNNAAEPFSQGSTTVTWTVTDGAGNTNTATQTVTVTDTEKPLITAPADVNVIQPADQCGVSAPNLGNPVILDNCTIASVTNDAPVSFSPGQTIVTWKVTDVSGNSATGTQKVTVIDNQYPTIDVPPAVIIHTDPGKNTATGVNLGIPHAADSCPVVVSNNAVEPFALGENSVIWKVADSYGNTTTGIQKVTVIDVDKPLISECSNKTANTDTGQNTYLYKGGNWNNIATDNDGMPAVSYSLNGATSGGGSTFNNVKLNIGVTSISVTAVDHSGNTNTCTFDVTVIDNEKPVLVNCPDNDVKLITDFGNSTYKIAGKIMDMLANDNDNVQSLTYTLNGATSGQGTSLDGVILNAGETNVTWTATDPSGNISSCNFKITVLDSNLPPVATGDNFTVKEGVELLESVRNNDHDLIVPNEMLKVSLVESTLHGKLFLHDDGTFSYLPDKDFIGGDYFTYQICKSDHPTLCSQAKVTITVIKNNECAVIVPDSFSPNGDGINDLFKIKCIYNYPQALFKVYSRSGIKVYEKKNYGNTDYWGSDRDAWWDGRSDNRWNVGGARLAAATYIYLLELEPSNKEKVITGTIFLNY
jgi:hypothetical protein